MAGVLQVDACKVARDREIRRAKAHLVGNCALRGVERIRQLKHRFSKKSMRVPGPQMFVEIGCGAQADQHCVGDLRGCLRLRSPARGFLE